MIETPLPPRSIPIGELAVGAIYRVRSRNLAVGVYCGDGGFIGIREKFGSRYLSTEYLPGMGGGGVKAIKQIGVIPEGIELRERAESRCSLHDRLTEFRPAPGSSTGEWYHRDDGSLMSPDDWSQADVYEPLFTALDGPTRTELDARLAPPSPALSQSVVVYDGIVSATFFCSAAHMVRWADETGILSDLAVMSISSGVEWPEEVVTRTCAVCATVVV